MIRERLANKLGSLIIKEADNVVSSYNRGDPETAGGDLAYQGKQWMDMPGPTSGSNAPMEQVRKLLDRRKKKKGPQVAYEEVT